MRTISRWSRARYGVLYANMFVAAPIVVGLLMAFWSNPARAANFSENFSKPSWFDDGNGVIHIRPSQSTAETDYAQGIAASAGSSMYARLSVQPLADVNGDGFSTCNPGSSSCTGPFTEWGLPYGADLAGDFGIGVPVPGAGAVTQNDIYLDVNFAAANPDQRFDWDSDLLDSQNQFLQDYIFNAGTANPSDVPTCAQSLGNNAYFVIAASNNSQRGSAYPEDPNKSPKCITTSGWYTFQHVFKPDSHKNLEVDMNIINSSGVVVASWVMRPTCMVAQATEGLCNDGDPLPFSAVGANFLGWFPDQEIDNLAIDNTILKGLSKK